MILRAREQAAEAPELCAPGTDVATAIQARPEQAALPSGWLFSLAAQPVMVVEASRLTIVQANPAAAELVQVAQRSLVGQPLTALFEADGAQTLLAALATADRAAPSGDAPSAAMRCRSAGRRVEIEVRVTLFRSGAEIFFLLHLAPIHGDMVPNMLESPVLDALESAAAGFLITDAQLRVEYANRAFLAMVDVPAAAEVEGKSLLRWLELTESDLAGLNAQMLQRQATSMLTVRLRSDRGSRLEAELCAVAVPDGDSACWGFTVRTLARLN